MRASERASGGGGMDHRGIQIADGMKSYTQCTDTSLDLYIPSPNFRFEPTDIRYAVCIIHTYIYLFGVDGGGKAISAYMLSHTASHPTRILQSLLLLLHLLCR